MNQVILIGRLTSDPDLKFFPSGIALSRFSLAIDRKYKKTSESVTDFIPVEVWGKKAEYCASYIYRGCLVAVNGELHFDRYLVDGEPQAKIYAKVVAENIYRLSVPGSQSNSAGTAANGVTTGDGTTIDNGTNNNISTTNSTNNAKETPSYNEANSSGAAKSVPVGDDDLPF